MELVNLRIAPEGTYLTWSDGNTLVCYPNNIEVTLGNGIRGNFDNMVTTYQRSLIQAKVR
jgi:hypothetical protein